jgi:hypothetical protein
MPLPQHQLPGQRTLNYPSFTINLGVITNLKPIIDEKELRRLFWSVAMRLINLLAASFKTFDSH